MHSIAKHDETTLQYPLGLEAVRGVDVAGDDFLTTAEAGKLLGISASRVRQLIYEREIPVKKMGPVILLRRSQLVLLTGRNPVGRPPKPK